MKFIEPKHFRGGAIIFILLLHCLQIKGQIPTLLKYEVAVANKNSFGFYFFSPVKISSQGNSLPLNMLLDGNGELLYFKPFSKGPFAGSFRLQPMAQISYYFDGKFFLMDSTFRIIDSILCKNGLETDPHEFIILPNGHYLLIATENVIMDLSSYNYFLKRSAKGSKRAKVICNVIQELDADKNIIFEWHGKDHYQFSDVDPVFLNDSSTVDWMHFNAIELDKDGNFLISVRNFNEITKVRKSDGKILWRLGGKKNKFRFVNDPFMFNGQHDVRKTLAGTLTLFDNGREGSPFHPEGAKEYKLDEKRLSAKLVWSYINKSNTCSSGYGSVYRANNGTTLINYGRSENSNTVFNVVTSSGAKVFEITSQDSIRNYRAYMYESLPFKVKRPSIISYVKNGQVYLEAEKGYPSYLWSNGEKTQIILVTQPSLYRVYVTIGDGGYISSLPYNADMNPR